MEHYNDFDIDNFDWSANQEYTNCGSYALGCCYWYCPYDNDDFNNEDMFYSLYYDGYSESDINQMILDANIEQILEDFPNARLCDKNETLAPNEELVAYRIHYTYDEDTEEVDGDFHFRVLRHGKWCQKNGADPVRDLTSEEVEDFEDEWIGDDGIHYTSNIAYFAVRRDNYGLLV